MPIDNQIEEENSSFEPQSAKSNLTRNQKLAAAGLAVFAVLVVVLWFAQLKSDIYGPFNAKPAAGQPRIDSQTASDLALKNKDTDRDGLSDYDELNLYKTSPYLEDSDSDGAGDEEEIKQGADPNCPLGRTCFSGDLTGQGAATSSAFGAPPPADDALNSLLNQYGAVGASLEADDEAQAGLTDEQVQILNNLDAASLRQLLLEAGMEKSALDKISDDELMQSYKETLQ